MVSAIALEAMSHDFCIKAISAGLLYNLNLCIKLRGESNDLLHESFKYSHTILCTSLWGELSKSYLETTRNKLVGVWQVLPHTYHKLIFDKDFLQELRNFGRSHIGRLLSTPKKLTASSGWVLGPSHSSAWSSLSLVNRVVLWSLLWIFQSVFNCFF